MTFLLELLSGSGLAQALAALLAALGVIAGAWFGGKRSAKLAARKQAEIDKAKDYIATREKLDNVEAVTDPSDARKRLHERNAGKP